jgi:hypothetical protein
MHAEMQWSYSLKNNLIESLYKINKSFMLFNLQDLNISLCYIAMRDRTISKISSKYCYDILATFDLLQSYNYIYIYIFM